MRFTAHLRAALEAAFIPGQPAEHGSILMVEPLTGFPKVGQRLLVGERRAKVMAVMAYDEFFDPNYEGCVGVAVDEHGLEAEGLSGAFVVALTEGR